MNEQELLDCLRESKETFTFMGNNKVPLKEIKNLNLYVVLGRCLRLKSLSLLGSYGLYTTDRFFEGKIICIDSVYYFTSLTKSSLSTSRNPCCVIILDRI